ncbi:hypothetical protein GW17_00033709 [Ensete ventricosum]|nr:hypothetical protein GW17_00033709 [Ensete ventricosum]
MMIIIVVHLFNSHCCITKKRYSQFKFKSCALLLGNACSLPALVPDQVRKLKQLTVLTLAETEKVLMAYEFVVLPYDQLMEELDVSNVRELEDFLINECMYAFAAGRDLRPEQLDNMIQTLSD